MDLKLPKETEKVLVAAVKRFAREEMDLDLGDLKAGLVLDFFLREAGPSIYNLALADAGRFFQERIEDLPGRELPEFGYWK